MSKDGKKFSAMPAEDLPPLVDVSFTVINPPPVTSVIVTTDVPPAQLVQASPGLGAPPSVTAKRPPEPSLDADGDGSYLQSMPLSREASVDSGFPSARGSSLVDGSDGGSAVASDYQRSKEHVARALEVQEAVAKLVDFQGERGVPPPRVAPSLDLSRERDDTREDAGVGGGKEGEKKVKKKKKGKKKEGDKKKKKAAAPKGGEKKVEKEKGKKADSPKKDKRKAKDAEIARAPLPPDL